jgi:hypothetical protein
MNFFCVGVMYSGKYDACYIYIFQACPVWIYTLRVTSHSKHRIHLSTLHQHRKNCQGNLNLLICAVLETFVQISFGERRGERRLLRSPIANLLLYLISATKLSCCYHL